MKKRNRLLAIVLTAIMTLSMVPSAVFATEAAGSGETAEAAVEEVSSVGEEQDAEPAAEEVTSAEETAKETVQAAEEDDEAEAEEAVTEEAADPAADQENEAAEEEVAGPEEAEEIAEPAAEVEEEVTTEEAAETVEWPVTLESRGSDYTVTASFDESAGFPADAKMKVSEIKKSSGAYQDYYDQALEAVQNETDRDIELTYARFFDITFYTEKGEVEPTGPVNVTIKYNKAIEAESRDDVHVLHFDDNDKAAPEIMDIETGGRGDKVNEVSFETDGFSVYAVIGTGEGGDDARLTVNFNQCNSDGTTTLIKTMYVKNSDKDDLETIIYDPGAGTVASGYSFYGWSMDDLKGSNGEYYNDTNAYVGQDYTAKTTPMTIAQVKTYIKGLAEENKIKEGDVLDVYAMIFTHYNVDYVDGKGVSVGSGSALVKFEGGTASYTVNMGYSTDDTHNFEGWTVTEGGDKIEGYPDNAKTTTIDGVEIKYYTNGTVLTISGDVKFSVNAPKGNWLVFNENGKNATYNAPQFIKSDEVTSDANLLTMVRNGYMFEGWYTGAPSATGGDPTGSEFTFGQPLTEKTTIYAKWKAITEADYTVIIWKQNVAGNGYDFVESVRPNGSVGTTPNTVDETNGHVTGAAYVGETGFSYKSTDQSSKTIAPEGNTVVNVYWDRIEYTLSFYSGNPNVEYKNTSGYDLARIRGGYTSYNYAIKIDDTWHQIDNRGNRIWSSSGISVDTSARSITYNYGMGTRSDGSYLSATYTITDSNLVKTITALYGANIRTNFPIVGTNGTTYTGASWSPRGSAIFDNSNYISYIDTMQAESTTFVLSDYPTSNYTTYHVKYYVESLPDDTNTVTFDGKTFTLYYDAEIHYTSSGGRLRSTESEEFTDITGYTKYGSDPAYSNGIADFDDDNTIKLFYTRNKYSILFLDGSYYDGNDNPIEETGQGEWKHIDNIVYGSSLASYNKGGDTYYAPTAPAGYVFEGWCIDDACTTPYTFTTMPEGGLTVYAKWRQIQYRVFLHPNATIGEGENKQNDPTLDWGNDQEMNFRVSYGGEVSTPEGIRTGYEFLGWYLDEGGSVLYPESFMLHENDKDYGQYFKAYDKTSDFTDKMDKWGDLHEPITNSDITGWNGQDRFWITKKLDVYAKWSKVTVGADGIYVVYDPGEGTGQPIDNEVHKDNTNAVAGAASKSNDSKKVFKQWVIQRWNGSRYVNTDRTVLPGDTFTIHVEDAKIVEGETVVALENVAQGHNYTYTIKLVAEYAELGDATPTHIPWYKNDGTKAFHIDTISGSQTIEDSTLGINQAVAIQGKPDREGYTFLGWARVEMTGDPANWERNSDNWTQDDLDSNNLYLYYDADSDKFYTDSAFTKEADHVAADESEPYHAMFAVWQKIPGYWVYHSTGGDPVFYEMPDDGTTIDLTEYVADKTKYLYGGYYHTDLNNLTKGDPYTEPGTRLVPVEDTVYYLKEVPNTYLKPQIYLIYNPTHNNLIQGLYGFVNVDSEDDYTYVGLKIGGTDYEHEGPLVSDSILVTKKGQEEPYATLNANNLFGMTDDCYIGMSTLSSLIDGEVTLRISGYYVTRDNIKVTGYKDRLITFPAGDGRYGGKPLFTSWGKGEGQTYARLSSVGTTATPVQRSSANHMMVVRTLKLAAPSDKIEYTITKIYDSGTEEQTVEGGNYTGQITYVPKDGYMFAGWYQDADFTAPADFSNVTGDMTVYAKYISNKDVTIAFSRKSKKSHTTTFNATISVKNRDQLDNVTVTVNDDISAVLADKSVKKSGSGKNVKYTTQYKGQVAVKGLSMVDSFTASASWITPDGTPVTGTNRKCTYLLGNVTVR